MAKKKTLWETYSPEQLAEAQAFCEDYKAFMSNCANASPVSSIWLRKKAIVI